MFGLMGMTTQWVKKEKEGPATIPEIMQAAVITGGMLSLLVAPMEGIKARLQVQYGNPTSSVYKYVDTQ